VGLGLALARRIVAAHGGHIGLSSELGAGTTARVRVPLSRSEPPAASG
jgi:signal transduction histidine kinase